MTKFIDVLSQDHVHFWIWEGVEEHINTVLIIFIQISNCLLAIMLTRRPSYTSFTHISTNESLQDFPNFNESAQRDVKTFNRRWLSKRQCMNSVIIKNNLLLVGLLSFLGSLSMLVMQVTCVHFILCSMASMKGIVLYYSHYLYVEVVCDLVLSLSKYYVSYIYRYVHSL